MSLRRISPQLPGQWEVDESGLVLARVGRGAWQFTQLFEATPEETDYLTRHGLKGASFSSRARGAEAVRLALVSEPRRAEPLTRWERVGEGVYFSADGHWRLKRSKGGGRFSPESEWAEAGASEVREQGGGWLLDWQVGYTLYMCAHRADRLNQNIAGLGLPVPEESCKREDVS